MTHPNNGGGGLIDKTANHTSLRYHDQARCNSSIEHQKDHTTEWRAGFTAGAVDALRRAERWLPLDPEIPEILTGLIDAYKLVGGDGDV